MKARVVRVRDRHSLKSEILSGQGGNFEILRAIVHAVQDNMPMSRRGGADPIVRRIVKDEILAERVGRAFNEDKVFDVAVDFSLPFEQAMRLAGFCTLNPEVTAERFYHRDGSTSVVEFGLTLVKAESAAEALVIMERRAFKPALSAELFAWGIALKRMDVMAANPYLPVVALGSTWPAWEPGRRMTKRYALCATSPNGIVELYDTLSCCDETVSFLARYCNYSAGYED